MSEKKFHAYPWWSPRFWHGMPLGVWLPLAAEHKARASLSRWGLMATITTAAAFNSVCEPLAMARYRRQLRERATPRDPLFILGHWRSGTTLLHEMLMLDERFFCPSTYQCFAPGHFLLTERMITSALSWIMPSKRPMDDVSAGWHRPQEDEFALVNLGAPSPYRRMAFPMTSPDRPQALDLEALPPAELARWKEAFTRFLRMLAVRDRRRLVLKSPPHTARMGVLADMFPEARFVHLVRDPFVVFPSTLRLWRSLHHVQSLQVDTGEALERYVFAAFDEMYAAFERDRQRLGPDRLHEIRYEDLVADPVARMEEVYDRLALGDFGRVRPRFEEMARSMQRYKTNRYDHDPRLVAEIARRWQPFIDRYGYQPPPISGQPARADGQPAPA
jgi:hypothetical protein